jgi:hypothetical protein
MGVSARSMFGGLRPMLGLATSEVVPLSELPHFRDGLNYLAPGAEIATVWDSHANLMPHAWQPLRRGGGHGERITPVLGRGTAGRQENKGHGSSIRGKEAV